MAVWLIAAVPRNENGFPLLDKLTVLEVFKHEVEPSDRLKHWCEKYPNNLIYALKPIISGIGFNEFKVTLTKH